MVVALHVVGDDGECPLLMAAALGIDGKGEHRGGQEVDDTVGSLYHSSMRASQLSITHSHYRLICSHWFRYCITGRSRNHLLVCTWLRPSISRWYY